MNSQSHLQNYNMLFLTLSLHQYVDRKTTKGYNKIKRAEVTYE